MKFTECRGCGGFFPDMKGATHHYNDAMLIISQKKDSFVRLTPPPALGSITIADAQTAATIEQHIRAVKEWAASVWAAWSPHHKTIRKWSPLLK